MLRRASKSLRLVLRRPLRAVSIAALRQPCRSPKLQRLWEQPSQGSRGSGRSHLEAPEALGGAISRLQRLFRPKCLRPRFSRVFSSFFESAELSSGFERAQGGSPSGFGRARRGLEWLRERSEVASSGLESAPKWLRRGEVASERVRRGFGGSGT